MLQFSRNTNRQTDENLVNDYRQKRHHKFYDVYFELARIPTKIDDEVLAKFSIF